MKIRKKGFTWNDLFEKKAVPIALLAGLVAFSYASVLSYLSIYAQEKDLLPYASLFFVFFAAVMLITRPFTGRIFDEKGPAYILIPGSLLFFFGLFILAFVNSPVLFLIAGAFIGLGYGALIPSMQTLAVQSTSHQRSGYATATFLYNIRYRSCYRILYFRVYCSSYGLPECILTIQSYLAGSPCFICIDKPKKDIVDKFLKFLSDFVLSYGRLGYRLFNYGYRSRFCFG